MKKILCSALSLVLVSLSFNGNSQSVFLQQYNSLPLKRIALVGENVIASDGYSFFVNDKNGKNIKSVTVNLSNAYLLQQMVTTSDSNIFCLYQCSMGSNTNAGIVVLSLDANLNFRWMENISNTGSAFGYGMTSSADNGVVICGTTCSTGFFLLKLNSNGEQAFIKNVNLPGYCIPYAVNTYKSNQFVIAARTQTVNDNEIIFVVDNAGNVTASKSIAFSNLIYVKSVKADNAGNIYSLVNESNGTSDIVKLSYDFSNNSIYHITNNNSSIQLNDIAFSNPFILAVGNINTGGSSNLNVLTLTVNTSTNVANSMVSGNSNSSNMGYNDAYSVISDNEKRFYMSGTSAVNGYIAKVNSDLTGFCNTNPVNLVIDQQTLSLADATNTINDGPLFTIVNLQANATAGVSAISGFCDYQEISSSADGIQNVSAPYNRINLYPSPASNELNVVLNFDKLQHASAYISDVLGRKVISTQMVNRVNKIDISGLSSGEYYISIIIDNQPITQKFIKAQ